MKSVQQQLFTLIQAALWRKTTDAEGLFDSHTDWNAIHQAAKEQGMLAIALDGINLLPEELRPGRILYLTWCAEALNIEDENKNLNTEVCETFSLLKNHGVDPVLLKGQGLASLYPDPLHRQSGDIDIYVGKKSYEKAYRLLLDYGAVLQSYSSKETALQHNKAEIELHRIIADVSNPVLYWRLRRVVNKWYGSKITGQAEIDDSPIAVPPTAFNIVYVLQHAVHHIYSSGLGLRQLCDWAMLIDSTVDPSVRLQAIKLLRHFGLTKASRIIGALLVKNIGLNPQSLILPYNATDEKYAGILLQEVWKGGNFGQHDASRGSRPRSYWKGKWYTFRNTVQRVSFLWHIAPREALWMPFGLISRSLRAFWFKLFNPR